MSSTLSIACPKRVWPWFGDMCLSYHAAAKDLGLKSEVTVVDTFDDYNRADVNLFFGAHVFMEEDDKTQTVTFNKPEGAVWAWYQMEQIPHRDSSTVVTDWRWKQTEGLADNFDWVLAESPPKVEYLRQKGIKSELLICGYHEKNEFPIIDCDEEFDFLFLGAMTPRRAKIIEDILNKTKLKMFPIRPFIGGRDKHLALKKSRIYLNIHMNDLKAFEKPRIIVDGLSNSHFVLSESIDHMEEFIDGEHFATAPYEELVEKLLYYVEHDEEREKIAVKGHNYVKQNYKITPSLEKVLGLING